MSFRCRVAVIAVFLGLSQIAFADDAKLSVVGSSHAWQRTEIRVEGIPSAANNFDPDLIRLDATFTAPSGQTTTVPAFWYQNYSRAFKNGGEVLTPVGAEEWRIRFTPTEVGEYSVALQLSQMAGRRKVAAPCAFELNRDQKPKTLAGCACGPIAGIWKRPTAIPFASSAKTSAGQMDAVLTISIHGSAAWRTQAKISRGSG